MSIFPFFRVESTDAAPQLHHRRRTSEAHSPPPRKSLWKRILEPGAIRMAFRLRQNFNSRFDNALRHNNTSQETLSTLKARTQDKHASGPGRRLSWVSQALGEPECDLDKIPLTPYYPRHCRVPAPATPPKASEPSFFGRPKRIRDEGMSDQRWTHPLRRQKATPKSPSLSSVMRRLESSTSSGRRAQPNIVAAVPASTTPQSSPTVTPSKRRASKTSESDTSSNKRPRLRSPTPHTSQSDQPTTESRQPGANPKRVSPGTQAILDYSKQALDDAHLASIKREEDLRNDVKFIEARLADARQRISELEQDRNNLETQLVAARQEHMPLPFLEFRREAEEALQQLRQQNAELKQENRGLRDGMGAVCRARDDALKAAATAKDASKAAAANASVEMSKLRKARDEALKKAAAADDALTAALASSRTAAETRTEQSQAEASAVEDSDDTQGEETSFGVMQPDTNAFTTSSQTSDSPLAMRNTGTATTEVDGFPVEEPMRTAGQIPMTSAQQSVALNDIADGEADFGREQVGNMQPPFASPSTSSAHSFAKFFGGQPAAHSAEPLSGVSTAGQNSAFGQAASQIRTVFPPSTSSLSPAASAFFATRPRQSDGSTIPPIAGSSKQPSAFGGSMAGMTSAFALSGSEHWRELSSSVGTLGGQPGESPRKVVVPAAHRLRNPTLSADDRAQRKRDRRKKYGNKSYVRDRDA